ncbi:phage tail protein [Chromobacterium sp. Beijing]|uniref:phage tail protein n=1 Tax=Chromobacterium sp. Beijing TaxID=2735795 RepID=UPI001F20D291|nr:phage tail protein [Chromobacterium sp. Beijing]UJB33747.1 phage tail protein [Chromobacterium sp. Beijing]
MLGLPMMALGLFVFTRSTLPYQEMKQQYGWRWPGNPRVGAAPGRQYTGPEEEPITLSGKLLPELTGGDSSLALLKLMADQALAWPLIEGTGMIYGFYVIEKLDLTRREFFSDGKAREIDFTLTLQRVDGSMLDLLGNLSRAVMELAF